MPDSGDLALVDGRVLTLDPDVPDGEALVFHSDRGGEFTSHAFEADLERVKARRSLSRPGECYDNAPAESFFASLKSDLTRDRRFATHAEARAAAEAFASLYEEALELASDLAELYALENEYRRTQRRVRALEKILLPELEEQQRVLEAALEELEIEEAVRVRLAAKGD